MKNLFLYSILLFVIIGVMFSGCERQMINPIAENTQEDSDQGDILVRHTGDPFIHGHLQPPPPLAEDEEDEEVVETSE